MLAYAVMVLLVLIVIILILKIVSMRHGARDIRTQLSQKLSIDTNTLISLSSNDSELNKLADTINKELKVLRGLRRKYQSGDRELKEAITNMSHDLRTPLTAILGYIELIKNEENAEQRQKYIGYIENRALALKTLTQELFSYSLISSQSEPDMQQVNLCVSLEDAVVGLYGAFIERGIEPEISMPEDGVFRCLDPKAVSRILGNILNNALKYSDGDLKIELTSSGKMTFMNTAYGLDKVQVGRLFDRFYTVESAKNSTGLGLSIAKMLTEKLGGKIWAEYSGNVLSICVEFGE